MVYTAESRSLALLEMLVQDDPLRAQYVLIPAHLPSTVSVEQIGATALPEDWRGLAARDQLQMVGSEWLHEARSCVLAVPSVVMPAATLAAPRSDAPKVSVWLGTRQVCT